jgi:hypothetical protein
VWTYVPVGLPTRAKHDSFIPTSWLRIVVETDSREIVAFYASATASILRSSTPKQMGRNQSEEMPAILLAPIAIDSRHKGQGVDAALLKHFMLRALEVAQSVGVRVLLTDAKEDEANSFYSHHAPSPSPAGVQTDQALASITVLIRSFHEASFRLPVIPAKWSDELADPCGGTTICHNDVCLENVVFW